MMDGLRNEQELPSYLEKSNTSALLSSASVHLIFSF